MVVLGVRRLSSVARATLGNVRGGTMKRSGMVGSSGCETADGGEPPCAKKNDKPCNHIGLQGFVML